MGLIKNLASLVTGNAAQAVVKTVEVFRPNAENSAQRSHDSDAAIHSQYSSEFVSRPQRSWFDSMIDGLNRLPRPMMVLAVFSILAYTPYDPIGMAKVFTAWAIIPIGFWSIAIAIVTFYFGGRANLKEQDFQRDMLAIQTRIPTVMDTLGKLEEMRSDSAGVADVSNDVELSEFALETSHNQAVVDWKASS